MDRSKRDVTDADIAGMIVRPEATFAERLAKEVIKHRRKLADEIETHCYEEKILPDKITVQQFIERLRK